VELASHAAVLLAPVADEDAASRGTRHGAQPPLPLAEASSYSAHVSERLVLLRTVSRVILPWAIVDPSVRRSMDAR
jgi:hypothetical protein